MTQQLWEILVPCNWNSGRPIRTRHHQEWDRRVLELTGGLTILKPGHGQWTSPEGQLFHDRMIPVRLMCDHGVMYRIAHMTIGHYEQEAVMYHMVSERCTILHASEEARAKFQPHGGSS